MPVPLIQLQRRLSKVGAIRAGGEKPERGVGRKLEAWRITSARQELIEQAAKLYGGPVTPWTSPNGPEFQVYTETAELPVLLIQGYSLQQHYELWEGATKRSRFCNGDDEEISGGACICNAEGVDRCDLYTRLVVALPELDTMLGWQLITRGANAGHEMPMMIDAARAVSSGPFARAILRLQQRRGIVNGQVARFVVPTLDLPVGYAALAAANGPMLELDPADPETPRRLRAQASAYEAEQSDAAVIDHPRRAAAFGPVSISPEDATAPDVPVDNGGEPEPQTKAASEEQKTKLNVLVGKLREAKKLTTDGIYNAVGTRLRNTAGLDLAMTTPDYTDDKGVVHKAIDDDGTTHWAPLRETLTRLEAHTLIEWLVKLEAREADPEPPSAFQAPHQAAQTEAEPEQQQITVPYNEFPPGY